MPGRNVLALLALMVGFAFERLAYYGVRSVLIVHLMNTFGMESSEARRMYELFTTAVYVLPILGAVLAVFAGPRITLLLGLLCSIAGTALLIPSQLFLLTPALGLIALGTALFRISIFAFAASLLSKANEAIAIGTFSLLYGAINLGAFLAPVAIGYFAHRFSYGVGFMLAAMAGVVALVTCAVAVAAGGVVEPWTFKRPFGLVGALLFVVALVPIYVLMELAGTRQYELAAASSLSTTLVTTLNSVVVMVASLVTAAVFLGLGARGRQLRGGWVFGAGAIVFALSAVPVAVGGGATDPTITLRLLVSIVLGAVAELVLSSAAIARIATSSAPRLVPLVLAPFVMTSMVTTWITGQASPDGSLLMWTALILTLCAGATALALGGIVHRIFFMESDAPQFAGPRTGPPPPPGSMV